MKQISFILLLVVIIGLFVYKTYYNQIEVTNDTEIKVLLVYNKDKNSDSIKAYESVLEEEGVPFSLIGMDELNTSIVDKVVEYTPAIIFPDGAVTYISAAAIYWIEEYIKKGGNVVMVYDAGRKDGKDHFRIEPNSLDTLLGLDMTGYSREGENVYSIGNIIFKNKYDHDFFGIPPGKLNDEGALCGYKYGKLTYPISKVKLNDSQGVKVFAVDQYNTPVITLKKVSKGNLLYVNTPLGYLKGRSDDLPLRSVLRTFLFNITHIPHIVSTPNARGTLVINWHIDSSIEHKTLPWILEHNYFREELIQSIHITAGPDLEYPGDDLGFNATGKGYDLIKQIMKYGKIGSHGGWSHNWYARNIIEKNFYQDEIKKYIQKNNEALESIVGYKITEYSAPVGVFPLKSSIEIMEELDMKAYYYVGDSGSTANRTFFEGKMLSENVIALPVMTFEKDASMYELNLSKWSEERVEKAYIDLVDYVVSNRSTRLYYSHPYDIHNYAYRTATKNFLDHCVKLQKEGVFQTRTMTDIAEFVLRVVNLEKKFILEKTKLHVEMKSERGFKDLVVSIPKEIMGKKIQNEGFEEDENYYYISLNNGSNPIVMEFLFEKI